jgi:hypothetical protein
MAKKKTIFEGSYEKEGILPEEYEFLDEPEEHLETPAEFELKMALGDKEVSVYTEEGISEELENDEIAPWEAGFMKGELHGGNLGECHRCGKVMSNEAEQVFDKEVHGVVRHFCSQECMNDE